jgi:hypothetical protein
VTRRDARWASLGLWGLIGVCWWQLLAAVFDARHFQPDAVVVVPVPGSAGFSFSPNNTGAFTPNNTGAGAHPTWIIAANLAYHLAYLLLAAGAAAVWLHHHYKLHDNLTRGAVWMLALCGGVVAVIGAGALLDRHVASAVADLGPFPDTMRAVAGSETVIGIGVLIIADLVARAMQRAVAAERKAALPQP